MRERKSLGAWAGSSVRTLCTRGSRWARGRGRAYVLFAREEVVGRVRGVERAREVVAAAAVCLDLWLVLQSQHRHLKTDEEKLEEVSCNTHVSEVIVTSNGYLLTRRRSVLDVMFLSVSRSRS